MVLPNFHTLRSSAACSLADAQNPKKIIFIHTGIILLVSLLLALINYLLEQQIGNTGGLSGIGARSVLSTVQSVLNLTRTIALPFWQMGYVFYTLKVAQGTDVGTDGLSEGFRRFGPVLRLKLLTAGIFFLVAIASSYISNAIFMLTPWSGPVFEALLPLMSGAMDESATMGIYDSLPMSSVIPMMVIFFICFIVVFLFVFYRYRLAELWLMDHPGKGAFAALRNSRHMMSGSCIALLKVDLHFWWFFLLDALVTAVSLGDLLLKAAGIPLPFSETAAFYIFPVAALLLQLALYVWKKNDVSVTYAHVYVALKPLIEAPEPTDN